MNSDKHLVTLPSRRRHTGVVGFVAGCAILSALATTATSGGYLDPLDPLAQSAAVSPHASDAMLLAASRAGDEIVTAGESGIVLTSIDAGATWQQAKVPVSVTLTSLTFPSPARGWAAGHSGVILSTEDGGKTWTRQLDGVQLAAMLGKMTPTKQAGGGAQDTNGAAAVSGDPFLDIFFKDERNGFAVGAFGLILRTRDGGRSWLPWQSHLRNPDGNHLYGVRLVGDSLFIVGERGSIYVSNDDGETFTALKSPYDGSFFGLTPIKGGRVLIYGLRGHAYLSNDRGQSWSEVRVGSGSAWLAATQSSDGDIFMVSQAGEIAHSADGGASFAVLPRHMPPLNAVVEASRGALVTAGVRGAARVDASELTHRSSAS